MWGPYIYKMYRNYIGYVPQNPYLFQGTLADNITLGEKNNNQSLNMAISLAQMEPDVLTMTQGLNEQISEFGTNLSGGQKQRVNIARAFYFKRPYLILDDSLSSLDNTTKANIIENLYTNSYGFLIASSDQVKTSRFEHKIDLNHEQSTYSAILKD